MDLLLKLSLTPYSKVEKKLYALEIWSSKGLGLPDFLGIGAPQSGSTWLYENLRCHPELYLPDQKELHYFDRGFHRSLRSYTNKFKPGCQKVKGEITPGYSILPLECIRFIQVIMPEVKLIFLMRNPIDRILSAVRRIFSRLPHKKFEEVDESEFYAYFRSERCRKRSDYLTILNNWISVFPREQLYLGFFDDIKNQPQKLLCDIFAHIDVSQDVDWNSFPYKEVINKNPIVPMPEKYRDFLEKMYYRDIEVLHERFGAPARWRCSLEASEWDT